MFSSVASAVLLALVVHDSALLLVAPAERIDGGAGGQQSRSASSEHAAVLVAGVVFISMLALLAVFSYVALYGVVFALLLLGLLAMTHRFPSGARKRDALDASRRLQVAAWLRLIAEIPLVLFAAGVTLALVEGVLGGDARGTAWLLLALVLVVGALALLERGERDDPYDAEKPPPVFDRPALLQTQWWASVFATVALADRYPQQAHVWASRASRSLPASASSGFTCGCGNAGRCRRAGLAPGSFSATSASCPSSPCHSASWPVGPVSGC